MMRNRKRRQNGSALVEMAFMMPWIAFLFVGILDSGFYTYAAIATQNAVRAVAIQSGNSGGSISALCQSAKNEMGFLPNVPGSSCAGTQAGVTNAAPIWVCTGILTNVSGSVCGLPAATCADCSLNAGARSVLAVLTYQSVPLIPIPGILPLKLQLTRLAEARIIE